MGKIYYTDRLVLKELDESNGELVLDYNIRNKEFFQRYEPKRHDIFYTLSYQKSQLKMDRKFSENNSMLRLWLFKKDNLDKIIGQITFYNIVPFAFLSCHIGYKCDKDEINKGYITEAMQKGIKIMFKEYNLHRLEGYVQENNKESLKVLYKLGFISEGIAHKFLEVNGIWKDHLRMVLINQ